MTHRAARTLLPILAAVMVSGAGSVCAAQTPDPWTSHVRASVTVAPPPLLLENTRDLQFGQVGAGEVVSVPARPDYPAGTWSAAVRFSGLRKQPTYGVSFTLPAALTNGSTSLPVSWSGTQYGWLCVWNQASGTPGVCSVVEQQFSPAAHASAATPLSFSMPNNSPGNNNFAADVYIGGRLTLPTGNLPPGTYTAPLTVTFATLN